MGAIGAFLVRLRGFRVGSGIFRAKKSVENINVTYLGHDTVGSYMKGWQWPGVEVVSFDSGDQGGHFEPKMATTASVLAST
jgi:hypothetical protein